MSEPLISASDVVTRREELCLLDATKDGRTRFEEEHVKGAQYVDLETDLTGPVDPADGGRHPLPAPESFAKTIGRLGIPSDRPIAIYDRHGGGLAAARAWWMLRAWGFRASVVDGGLDALRDAGAPLAAGAVTPTPSAHAPRAFSLPQVTIARVREGVPLLIDARAEPRFRGEVEPLDPVAGHIPGAQNRFWKHNLDNNGRFLSPEELRKRWIPLLGDHPPSNVVHQCGSGVTACHNLLALEIAGLGGGALYVGSFSEWCRHEPIVTT